jgi:NADH-quinone oxidoreductase subunit L
MAHLVWLIPAFPLIGFLILGLGTTHISKKIAGIIASTSVLLSFCLALSFFIGFLKGNQSAETVYLFDWISSGNLHISFSFLLDHLSVLMTLIITGIGFLIHVYSIGYMHDDEGFNRFFAYLNLFIFSMLLLVLGANYVILFIGWEGVGLCSYLLIGFWFKNQDYNDAAKKAFIMNRIGDLGFLLGIFLIYMTFGSLEFKDVFSAASTMPTGQLVITSITLLLFIGAMGKSAQIPLYTWLPDAMAGPTPVSALIHAATMVTAGIYMIARSNVLYTLAPVTLNIILVVGVLTALFAATIGLVQNDIKKVLAYSTVSQLGFMFIALGLGAYSTAVFHLMTHAFFKALLFLGAGSVIHAMGGEQDIRKMGGLKKHLPITYITFLIGTLAISGIPPFAGFFSKDEILAAAYENNKLAWIAGMLGSLMTAFYMFRLFFLTFSGTFRGTDHQSAHLHESPKSITIPLVALAALSALGGFLGIPEILGGAHALKNYLNPIFGSSLIKMNILHGNELSHGTEYALMAIAVIGASLVIYLAYVTYVKKEARPEEEAAELKPLHKLVYHKYYIDECYQNFIVRPLNWTSGKIYGILELSFVDKIVNNIGRSVVWSGKTLRYIQNGNLEFYIFSMVIGIIAIIVFNLY